MPAGWYRAAYRMLRGGRDRGFLDGGFDEWQKRGTRSGSRRQR